MSGDLVCGRRGGGGEGLVGNVWGPCVCGRGGGGEGLVGNVWGPSMWVWLCEVLQNISRTITLTSCVMVKGVITLPWGHLFIHCT